MFFDDRPNLALGGWAKGEPSSGLEGLQDIFRTSAEAMERNDAQNARWRMLNEEIEARNKIIFDLTGKKEENPLYGVTTPEDRAEMMRDVEERSAAGGFFGQFDPAKSSTQFAWAYRLKRYERRLEELAREHPDFAAQIAADVPPSLMVMQRARNAEQKSAEARERYGMTENYMGLPNLWTHPLGMVAAFGGAIWGQRYSPADIAVMLGSGLAGHQSKSLIKNAALSAAANAAGQAVLEPGVQGNRAALGLDYGLGQSFENIAGAGVMGGVLDFGVRGAVRGVRALRGEEGLGGVLRDAPTPEAPVPDAPAPAPQLPTIDPELAARVQRDDPAAIAEVARAYGLDQSPDPAVRGALANLEAEAIRQQQLDQLYGQGAVDSGEGVTALLNAIRAIDDPDAPPAVRAPEPLPEARALPDDETARALGSNQFADKFELDGKEIIRREVDAKTLPLERQIAGLKAEAQVSRDLLGRLILYERLDGSIAVLDGSKRVAMAQALPETSINVPAIVMKESAGWSEPEARRIALRENIRLGDRLDPIDIARSIKADPELIDRSVEITTPVRYARALAALSDDAFGMVERGEASVQNGVLVADHVADKGMHQSMLANVERFGGEDIENARAVINTMLPPDDVAVSDALLGVRRLAQDREMPLDGGSRIDDPAGAEAKRQTQLLEQNLAQEIADAKKRPERIAKAVDKAERQIEKLSQKVDEVRAENAEIDRQIEKKQNLVASLQAEADKATSELNWLQDKANKRAIMKRYKSPEAYQRALSRAEENASFDRGIEGLKQEIAALERKKVSKDPSADQAKLREEVARKDALQADENRRLADVAERAAKVEAAIAAMMPMVPEGVAVRTFSTIADLPGELGERVAAMAKTARAEFAKQLLAAKTPREHTTALKNFTLTLKGEGPQAFYLSQDKTIWLATYAINPEAKLHHEIVHALRDLGLLTERDLADLAARARELRLFVDEDMTEYQVEFRRLGEAMRLPPDQIDAFVKTKMDEEAAAHMVEMIRKNPDLATKPEQTLIERVMEMFRRLRERLRGQEIRDTDQLLKTILSGEAAKRELARRNSVRDAELVGPAERYPTEDEARSPMMAMGDRQVTPGLDMSPEARKQRAEAMGFDTSRVWYHGTRKQFDKFKAASGGELGFGVYVTHDPTQAAEYTRPQYGGSFPDGANVVPMYVRGGMKDLDRDAWLALRGKYMDELQAANGGEWNSQFVRQAEEMIAAEISNEGYGGFYTSNPTGQASFMFDQGVVFDPKNIRSINAAFDPANADSPNLMFAIGDRDGNIVQFPTRQIPAGYRELTPREAEVPLRNALRSPDAAWEQINEAAQPLLSWMAGKNGFALVQTGIPKDQHAAYGATILNLSAAMRTVESDLGQRGTYPPFQIHIEPTGKLGRFEDGYGYNTGIRVPLGTAQADIEAALRKAWVLKSSDLDNPNLMFSLGDRETGQSMRRDLDSLGYYSKALEAARGLKQAKGTAEQMLAQIKSAGVKDAEIEATNLKSFLEGKKSVTRDEIISHLEQNRVGVREVEYGYDRNGTTMADTFARLFDFDQASETTRSGQTLADIIQQLRGREFDIPGSSEVGYRFADGSAIALSEDRWRVEGQRPTKWSSYSLDPSNPTYRETVLHLPRNFSMDDYKERLRSQGLDPSRFTEQQLQDGFAEANTSAMRITDGTINNRDFQSGHFPDPNIIGHMMTSMVKHEGKPVFLIDQIQSDWGQKLRDGGVRDEAKIADLKRRESELSPQVEAWDQKIRSEWGWNPRESGYDVGAWAKAHGRDVSEFQRLKSELRLVDAELRTAEAATPGNPLVNTTDQWTTTTLRRAIRIAAEADADYIAIPAGDTVLSYNPGDENGMRQFYGSVQTEKHIVGIVPKNLQKLLEKIDKAAAKPSYTAKVETPTYGMKGEGFTLFPLTDAVKRSVIEEGQPMFAFGGERAKTADLDALAEAKRMMEEGASRDDIWNATGWMRMDDGRWRYADTSRPPWLDYDVPDDQQIVRFGSDPMYSMGDRPVTPGLDMSPEARKQRAEQMGFDTGRVWYHGTPDNRGIWADGFKTQKEKYGGTDPDRVYFFAADRRVAATYADDRRAFDYQNAVAETIPVYLKSGKQKVVEWNGRPFRGREKDGSGFAIRDYIDQARAEGYDSVLINNVVDTYEAKGKPSTIIAVFKPENIRSINAAFDPANSDSPNLMYSMGDRTKEEGPRPEPGARSPKAEAMGASRVLAETPEYKRAAAAAVKAFNGFEWNDGSKPEAVTELSGISFKNPQPAAAAVEALARSYGHDLTMHGSGEGVSQYGTLRLTAPSPDGNVSIDLKIRVSDHGRQSMLHDAAHLNLTPDSTWTMAELAEFFATVRAVPVELENSLGRYWDGTAEAVVSGRRMTVDETGTVDWSDANLMYSMGDRTQDQPDYTPLIRSYTDAYGSVLQAAAERGITADSLPAIIQALADQGGDPLERLTQARNALENLIGPEATDRVVNAIFETAPYLPDRMPSLNPDDLLATAQRVMDALEQPDELATPRTAANDNFEPETPLTKDLEEVAFYEELAMLIGACRA